jgi:hypothetical protein
MSTCRRFLSTLAVCAALAVGVVVPGGTGQVAQAANGSYGDCTFTYSGMAATKTAYVSGVTGCQGATRVAARVYWYSSGTGTTEYSTTGSYVASGNTTATFSSGVYSRAYFAGKY